LKRDVDVREGERHDLALAFAPPGRPTPPAPPRPPPRSTSSSEPSTRIRTPTWIAIGGAGAAALVGTIAGIASIGDKNAAEKSCDGNVCPPSTFDDIDRARSLARVSTVSFAIAGAAGVGAIVSWFLLRDGPAANHGKENAYVAPWIGAGAAGVGG